MRDGYSHTSAQNLIKIWQPRQGDHLFSLSIYFYGYLQEEFQLYLLIIRIIQKPDPEAPDISKRANWVT